MGINAKSIKVCGVWIWKFLKLSMIASYKFFKKDPYVGVILILIFLLYLFYPFYFIVLVVCSPLIVLVAVILRVYLKYKRRKAQDVKEVEKKKPEIQPTKPVSFKKDDIIILRNNGTAISRQMSRRRNFKDRNRLDWDSQAGSEKKDDIVALTANTMELLGLTSQIEDKPRVILDVSKSVSLDHEEGSTAEKVLNSKSWPRPDFTSLVGIDERNKQSQKYDGSGGEAGTESMEEEDDDDDDEESQEEGNKALEWTKDDQKNLMDLGLSEIERNNRLEILIAKRRARKEGGKGLIDTNKDSAPLHEIGIAPIAVSRTNHCGSPFSEDLPGSAPPVLLPSRNPFDLPYDPHEEKPNLMGDNFHEEFTVPQPFCRHESFTMGTSFLLNPRQDQQNSMFGPYFGTLHRDSDVPVFPRCQTQPKTGDHDELGEQLFSLDGKSVSPNLRREDLVQVDQLPNQELNSVEMRHGKDEETDNRTTQSHGEEIKNAQNIESESAHQSQAQIKADGSKVNYGESSASSSSNEDDIVNANIAGVAVSVTSKGRNFPDVLQPVKNSLYCSTPKKIAGKESLRDSSPFAEDKAIRDHLFDTNRKFSYTSIASDMQVEVSDVGSPRPTVNESFAYDGDNEKEISSGSEDFFGATPRVGGIEERPSSLVEVLNGGGKASAENGQPNLIDSGHKVQDKKNQVVEAIGHHGTSMLSLECLEAEQLIETLRFHPELLRRDESGNLTFIDDRDDETNSEYTDDNSEKQSAHEGTSDIPEAMEERGNSNLIKEENPSAIELGSSETDQSLDDHNACTVPPGLTAQQVHDNLSASSSPSSGSLEKHHVKNTIAHSSSNSDQKNSQEQSNHPEWTSKDANELPTDNKKDENLSSMESSKGESDISISHAAAEKSNSTTIEGGTEGAYHNVTADKSTSNNPGTLPTDQKSNNNAYIDSPSKSTEESRNLGFTGGNDNLGKVNELEDMAEADRKLELTNDAQGDTADTADSKAAASSGLDNPSNLAGKEPNDHRLQTSGEASNMLRGVNETLMSEIMNEEKDISFGQGEELSQVSNMEEPVLELLSTVDESESRSIKNNEAESNDSSDAIQNFKSESETLIEGSAMMDNRANEELTGEQSKPSGSEVTVSKPDINDGQKGHDEVTSQSSATEEPVSEPLTTVDESNSRSSGDIESESMHSPEVTQNVKGESESSIKDNDEMVSKPAVYDSEVSDSDEGRGEVESQPSAIDEQIPEPSTTAEEHNSRSTKDIEGESKNSSEDIRSVKGDSEASTKDSTEMNKPVNQDLTAEPPKLAGSEAMVPD